MEKILKSISSKNILHYAVLIIFTIILFQFTYGLIIINPKNIGWLLDAYHDWGTHYLGWAFYRNESWTFPLGDISNLYYPIGTNVGLTDSIPLLAIPFKIFSIFLPEDFQYFGLWLILCHYLLAHYSFKIFKLYQVNSIIAIIASIVIAYNPVIVYRAMHPSLCAHFLIAASLYYYLKSSFDQNWKKIYLNQSILLLISAAINPYLTFLIGGFNIILLIKQYKYQKVISLKIAGLYLFYSFTSVLFFWIMFGMIDFNSSGISAVASHESIRDFGFNLNSFFNSMGYSKFFIQRPLLRPQQYEGFAYLGIGIIILLILTIALNIKKYRKLQKKEIPLVGLVLAFFLFAMSNQITFDDNILFEYPIPRLFDRVASIFRASGRMIWPLYYLLLYFAFISFSKVKLNKYIILVFILLISSLQIYDIQNLISQRKLNSGTYNMPLDEKKWLDLMDNFDVIITYPLYDMNLKYPSDYQDLCYLTLKSNKRITNGYVARNKNPHKTESFKQEIENNLLSGKIGNELFICMPGNLPKFTELAYKDKIIIQQLDGYFIIYNKALEKQIPVYNKANKRHFESLLTSLRKPNVISETKSSFIKSKNLKYNLDNFNFSNNIVALRGWAFLLGAVSSRETIIYITFTNGDKSYISQLQVQKRPDLVEVYKSDYEDAGFNSAISTSGLPNGKYELGLLLKDSQGKEYFGAINQIIEVK